MLLGRSNCFWIIAEFTHAHYFGFPFCQATVRRKIVFDNRERVVASCVRWYSQLERLVDVIDEFGPTGHLSGGESPTPRPSLSTERLLCSLTCSLKSAAVATTDWAERLWVEC